MPKGMDFSCTVPNTRGSPTFRTTTQHGYVPVARLVDVDSEALEEFSTLFDLAAVVKGGHKFFLMWCPSHRVHPKLGTHCLMDEVTVAQFKDHVETTYEK